MEHWPHFFGSLTQTYPVCHRLDQLGKGFSSPQLPRLQCTNLGALYGPPSDMDPDKQRPYWGLLAALLASQTFASWVRHSTVVRSLMTYNTQTND